MNLLQKFIWFISLLKTIQVVNALKLEENDILVGHGYHTAGSEPYFFINSYTYTKRLGAIPVDLNGRCVVAEEIGDRDKDTMRPLKWKCTNECRKLTSEEVELVVRTKSLFQMSIEDLRAGLDGLDSGCSHVHTDITLKLHSGFIEQLGHPIYCELPECSSPLRVIRAAMPHFPVLRIFTRLLYKARKCHMTILAIDSALSCGNIDELIPFRGLKAKFSDLFSEDGVEHAVVREDHSSSGLGCIERDLKVTHADLIAELQSKFNDDAEFACCSCERLCQRKQVSRVNFSLDKYKTDAWQRTKALVLQNEDVEENRAAKRQRYQEDVEENCAAKRQRYQEDVEENRAAKRPKYEDNSAAIKASERNRYWNDPAVRLAKRAAERKRYRRGHRTTTTTQSYSLYEPKSHALMEYNGGLEKAILRDSELLSEVNDAFCKSHPLLAQKVVTRSACAAPPLLDTLLPPYRPPPAAAATLPLLSRAAPTAAPTANSRAAPTSSSRSRSTAATCTSPTTGTSIGTSAPTTTLPAATLAAATTTRMAPMARTRPLWP
ncbi:hypothetical protein EMCRGX_G030225 [Ephydatia muelleri]